MDKEKIKEEIVRFVKENEGCSIVDVQKYLSSKNLIRGYSTATIYVYELINEGKIVAEGNVRKKLKVVGGDD